MSSQSQDSFSQILSTSGDVPRSLRIDGPSQEGTELSVQVPVMVSIFVSPPNSSTESLQSPRSSLQSISPSSSLQSISPVSSLQSISPRSSLQSLSLTPTPSISPNISPSITPTTSPPTSPPSSPRSEEFFSLVNRFRTNQQMLNQDELVINLITRYLTEKNTNHGLKLVEMAGKSYNQKEEIVSKYAKIYSSIDDRYLQEYTAIYKLLCQREIDDARRSAEAKEKKRRNSLTNMLKNLRNSLKL